MRREEWNFARSRGDPALPPLTGECRAMASKYFACNPEVGFSPSDWQAGARCFGQTSLALRWNIESIVLRSCSCPDDKCGFRTSAQGFCYTDKAPFRGEKSARQRPMNTQFATHVRGVAQPGRAPGSGPGGRRFKSSLPDHHILNDLETCSDKADSTAKWFAIQVLCSQLERRPTA